jgi:hypothetical protein
MTFLFAIHPIILSLLFFPTALNAGPKEDNFKAGWLDALSYIYQKASKKEQHLKEAAQKRDHLKLKELLTPRDIALYPEILEEALYSNWKEGLQVIFKCTGSCSRPGGPATLFNNLLKKREKEGKPLSALFPTLIKKFGTAALPTLELLVSHGFSLNEADAQGHTALHEACMKEDETVVAFLLENGADPLAQDNEGNTPLHIATLHKKASLIPLLLAQAPHILEIKNKAGDQAIHVLLKTKEAPDTQTPITVLDATDKAVWESFSDAIDIYATNSQGISLHSALQSQPYWCTPTPQMLAGAPLTAEQEHERESQCSMHTWLTIFARRASNTKFLKQQLDAQKAAIEREYALVAEELMKRQEKLESSAAEITAVDKKLQTAKNLNHQAQEENKAQLEKAEKERAQKLAQLETHYQQKIATL